jgi:GT2 family glycosyltransferase
MFNSSPTLQECLASIPPGCEVVVVDQQSGDDSIAVARQLRPDATIIKAGANRGFAAGCNLGAANATGDVLVFLNPDAAFLSATGVQILAESAMSKNALVGPRIVDPDGHDQTRARLWSTVLSELGEVFLPKRFEIGRFRRDIPPDDGVYRAGGEVPYIQGSCMVISAANFWRVNGLDERLFLYREEEILALRLHQIEVKTLLEPQAAISHIGAKSTSQLGEFSVANYYRSEVLFFMARYPKPMAAAATIALWILLTAMAVTAPIRPLIGLRPDKGYRWYRAAASGVVSGWRRQLVEPPPARRGAEADLT